MRVPWWRRPSQSTARRVVELIEADVHSLTVVIPGLVVSMPNTSQIDVAVFDHQRRREFSTKLRIRRAGRVRFVVSCQFGHYGAVGVDDLALVVVEAIRNALWPMLVTHGR